MLWCRKLLKSSEKGQICKSAKCKLSYIGYRQPGVHANQAIDNLSFMKTRLESNWLYTE